MSSTDFSSLNAFPAWQAIPNRILTDMVSSRKRIHENDQHLQAAVNWMKRAHDNSDRDDRDDGVSYGYCLRGQGLKNITNVGWRPSYVETSGYIVETFYNLAVRLDDSDCHDRAEKIARWLVSVQNDDGSFSNNEYGAGRGIVFDTGQVLFGLTRAFVETQDQYFLNAALKASRWLEQSMDKDGAWRRNTHLNHVHTYNTRSAWAMLELDRAHPDAATRSSACRNLDWAITQQFKGFFNNCAFKPGLPPFTHTIAYAIRGLLEGGRLTGDQSYNDAAVRSARRVREYVEADGFIPGRIGTDGERHGRSCCLTGNAQLAIIWYQLAENKTIPDRAEMLSAADRALEYVMSVQDIRTRNQNVHGAIKGSHPIWGKYTPMAYPNWATKFFIDAMLLQEQATRKQTKQSSI